MRVLCAALVVLAGCGGGAAPRPAVRRTPPPSAPAKVDRHQACAAARQGTELVVAFVGMGAAPTCAEWIKQQSGDNALWARAATVPSTAPICKLGEGSLTMYVWDSGPGSDGYGVCGDAVHQGWREVP